MKAKAAVIGSGFGGLSLAIRLQASGFDTTIYEKRNLPGGRAYVYKQDGFTFDAGPTVITAPQAIEELFELSGQQMSDYVDLIPITPFYRLLWEGGKKFDYSNDMQSLEKQIKDFHPEDWDGYKKFFKYSYEVFQEGYEKLVDVPFPNFWSMIKVAPQLVRLQAHRSVYSMVAKYIKDPYLRQAFSFHSLLIGGNPFTSSSIYTLIHYLERNWGVFFPKGGTGQLVQALAQLFSDLGGRLVLNAEVDEICSHNKKVTGLMVNGQSYSYDIVASNADVTYTYKKLLAKNEVINRTRKKLERNSYSMSLFLVYFGTNKKFDGLVHHNILFGHRYKKLLSDIFNKGILTDDFSIYLHSPCETDPSLAPKDHYTYYALAPVPHMGKWQGDWNEAGPQYADRIFDYLEQHYMPNLRQHIVTQKIFTPLDFQTELNAHLGSAFSIEPVLTQSAYFRAQNKDKNLNGLYFVGAGTHPGAGVPGVINSAKATHGVILKDFPTMPFTPPRPDWPDTNHQPEAPL